MGDVRPESGDPRTHSESGCVAKGASLVDLYSLGRVVTSRKRFS